MTRLSYRDLAVRAAKEIEEITPWDLAQRMSMSNDILLVDVREPSEFVSFHIAGSINVPRGVIEPACEWDYPETEPRLVEARDHPVVLICRSGHRSALTALTLKQLGYEHVMSLKLGLRGWNDGDLPLVKGEGETVDGEAAAAAIDPMLRPDQRAPLRR